MLHAIVMAGGSGTRFWPKSRRSQPKQLLSLFGGDSLLQDTVARVAPLVSPERTWIITGDDQAEATHAQLPQIPRENIVGEPFPRDTAPCVGLAAAIVAHRDPDATMVVVPADHVVRPAAAFQMTVGLALELLAENPDALITFGVRPTRPETGYGYIERGELVATRDGVGISRVKMFREKPERKEAEEFLAAGTFAWNSGVFIWRAQTILREMRTHRPDVGAAIDRIAAALGTPRERAVIAAEYEHLPRVPIDKAVMEKAASVYVLEVVYDWSDVGDWRSLAELKTSDEMGNICEGPVHAHDTRDCVVLSEDGNLITTLGVENLVIVQAGGATLVARREHLDNLKKCVERLGDAGFSEYL